MICFPFFPLPPFQSQGNSPVHSRKIKPTTLLDASSKTCRGAVRVNFSLLGPKVIPSDTVALPYGTSTVYALHLSETHD